jgi:hypothetical protein
MNVQVHLIQRLLHMLQVNGRNLDQTVPVPPERTNRTDLVIRPKRSPKETNGVEVLQPLTILHICFPPGYIPDVLSVDQHDLDAPFLKNLE